MNNRTYKRPMFRKGGSADSAGTGITSGLNRPGYQGTEDPADQLVTPPEITNRERVMKAMGAQAPGRNINDFLINFGLNMVGNAPTGNIFQTAATQAKEPYSQFAKANEAEQNLLRQVGLETEMMDIKTEADVAAREAKQEFESGQLDKKIKAEQNLYDLERQQLKDADKKAFINDYTTNGLGSAVEGANEWEFQNNITNQEQFKGLELGGTIENSVILLGGKDKDKWIKGQKKKNKALNKIYLNKSTGDIYKMVKDDEDLYDIIKVGNTGGGFVQVADKEYGKADSETEFGDAEITLLTPQAVGFENKPVFETMAEVRSVIKFPMTGQEIIDTYALSDFSKNINPRMTYTPYKEGDPFFRLGKPFK